MSQSTKTSAGSHHYTFGDNAVAAQRLQFLSELFRPSLEAFVQEHAGPSPRHVLDLGCGPGHTTRALARLLTPAHITGLDHSERFLAEARSAGHTGEDSPPRTLFHYEQHDVTQPLPGASGPGADLLYARFLLTHLSQPAAALATWAGYVRSGARLLLQETASMSSPHPALGRYYELVAELQRRHGQRLDVGASLAELADGACHRVLHAGRRTFTLPGSSMARLHRMNLATWRFDPAAALFDADELDSLQGSLTQLSEAPAEAAEVHYAMGELVLERR